jgi:predicted ester cyclase
VTPRINKQITLDWLLEHAALDMLWRVEHIEAIEGRIPMSLETTAQTINSYLDALLKGEDFGRFFTDNVRWTTMETGDEIRGREVVRDFIVTLHRDLFDAKPEVRSVAIADGMAALEADFVGVHRGEFAGIAPTGASVRVPYSVFYDVDEQGITALRAYMPVRQMVAELEAASAGGS